MNYGIQVLVGFAFGIGFVVAALVMKLLFQVGVCG